MNFVSRLENQELRDKIQKLEDNTHTECIGDEKDESLSASSEEKNENEMSSAQEKESDSESLQEHIKR